MSSANIHRTLVLTVMTMCAAYVAQAQTPATTPPPSQPAPSNPAAEGDVTTVTVFGKLKPPTSGLTIRTDTASSCGFMSGQNASTADYVRGAIRQQSYDRQTFSASSPFGDASTGFSAFDRSRTADDRSGFSGCSAADYGFAAGRAHIARRDTTMRDAADLFNAGKYPEALAMFKKSYSKMGYREAAVMIAKMHLYGVATEKDVPEAIKWFEDAAAGHEKVTPRPYDPTRPDRMSPKAEASMMLAKIYLIGFDVPKNPKATRKWFDRAYDLGFVPAGKALGDIYYFGYDTPRDLGKAAKLYTGAAEYSFAPAQYALANILYSGEETIKADPNKALDWYWHAARQKHPGATYAVARAYDLGENVKADPDRALSLYKEAAIGGDGDAQNALGTYFYNGQILPKDQVMARKWFEAAAVRGQADGMFNLGVMMMKGEGGETDHTKAYAWLTLAQTAGHPNAEAVLKILEGRMTPAEKAAAEALLSPQA
ncbi:SEL1-like repeat protein [Asticcacaulis endophyticus]|nr:SEL1-like repeat protein [Asticcacaulis endophyticus]